MTKLISSQCTGALIFFFLRLCNNKFSFEQITKEKGHHLLSSPRFSNFGKLFLLYIRRHENLILSTTSTCFSFSLSLCCYSKEILDYLRFICWRFKQGWVFGIVDFVILGNAKNTCLNFSSVFYFCANCYCLFTQTKDFFFKL